MIYSCSPQFFFKKLLCLNFIGCLFLASFAQSPKKLALIIAVGEYAPESGWANLSSANDALLLTEVLIRQGFEKKYITILQDKKATKEGIQKAFKNDLLAQAKEGDRVVFHFSGHGQQIADQNDDELDGYDEAIVPYDSPMRFERGVYEGEKLIRDDELGIFFQRLRQKLGNSGQLLVLLDACHSGTATRGYGVARGSQYKMASTDYNANRGEGDERGFFQTNSNWQNTDLAPMITIAASAAQELNYEFTDKRGVNYGPLTYAFSNALGQVEARSNYRTLFDYIQQQMVAISPRQTPEIEGPLDVQIFNGGLIPTPNYSKVLRTYDSRTIVIDAGLLQGLSTGSRLAFYPIGTTDTTNQTPIVTGEIINSLPLISEVVLHNKVSQRVIKQSWGVLTQQNYGEIKLNLMLDLDDTRTEERILEVIEPYEVIEINTDYPDLVLKQFPNTNRFILATKDGFEIADEVGLNERTLEKLVRYMLTYIQADFLRQLDMKAEEMAINIELIPVMVKSEGGFDRVDKYLDIEAFKNPHLTFRDGDNFVVRVQNLGSEPAYFSLLDVQADHQITTAMPNFDCGLAASDLYIEPGQSKTIDCILGVYPPYGKEILKLIATEKPLDLSRIIEKRGNKLNLQNPFEQLFQSTFKDSNKKRSTTSIPPSSAHISTLVFEIIP